MMTFITGKMGSSKRMKPEKRKNTEVGNMEIEFELIDMNDSMEDFLEK